MPCLSDFPGTEEDEISFKRGEIVVVIAKDDGFGDGWWRVTPLFDLRFCTLLF
jgi:hypothetical protein